MFISPSTKMLVFFFLENLVKIFWKLVRKFSSERQMFHTQICENKWHELLQTHIIEVKSISPQSSLYDGWVRVFIKTDHTWSQMPHSHRPHLFQVNNNYVRQLSLFWNVRTNILNLRTGHTKNLNFWVAQAILQSSNSRVPNYKYFNMLWYFYRSNNNLYIIFPDQWIWIQDCSVSRLVYCSVCTFITLVGWFPWPALAAYEAGLGFILDWKVVGLYCPLWLLKALLLI